VRRIGISSGSGGGLRLVLLVLVLVVAVLALAAAGCGGDDEEGDGGAPAGDGDAAGTVAFLLPENVTPRWEGPDRENFTSNLQELAPDAEIIVSNAVNDPARQLQQAEQALTQGAEVLVVAAVDQEAAGRIVQIAEQQDVPVIAYDRLIQNAPLDYYVTFDGRAVGEAQGQWLVENTEEGDRVAVINGSTTDDNAHWFKEGYDSVLDPLFESGERVEVDDQFVPGWEPTRAQQIMEQILTRTNNGVDAVLSANDGMAGGIIAALDAQGLAGEVPVTGQDATVEGVQRIILGTQGMSIFKDIREQAEAAAQIVAALLAGEEPDPGLFGEPQNNGEVDVQSVLLPVVAIDTDNLQELFDSGFVTQEEACEGVPAGTGPC
jgi:D-xylose transport system substrate-binding protein